MLYGFRDGAEWVIIAADDSAELDEFAESNLPGLEEVDAFSLMVNADYSGLGRAYRIPTKDSPPVVEIGKARAADVQRNMRSNDPDYDDPYQTHSKEERTIREIAGLTEVDPWDRRSEEEIAKDEEMKARIEEHKQGKTKGGNGLSGESFSPKRDNVGITDVRGYKDADGKVTITDVIAQKGLWDEAKDEAELPENPNRIENKTFKKLFRLDVHGVDDAGFDALLTAVPSLEIDKMIVQRGLFDEDGSKGVWVASGIQRLALKVEEAFKAANPDLVTEVYAVNRENERLVPKGVTVVDTDAPREIGPRPWNDRAAEWYAWTDEQRAEEIKNNVKGDEFIFAGSHSPVTGSTVWITPKDYFDEHGEPWAKESLPLGHLLPNDFKEESPGIYNSYARDWVTATFHIGQTGIRESWMFRIYLNNLGL